METYPEPPAASITPEPLFNALTALACNSRDRVAVAQWSGFTCGPESLLLLLLLLLLELPCRDK
jgi:hypothetical protein